MSVKDKLMIFAFSIFLISGCSVQKGAHESSASSNINKSIDDAIAAIQKTQIELYQYGAISQKKNGITGGVYSDGIKIDANWNGDAAELLKKMAEQRNYSFRVIGNKLPLPVTVKVDKSSFKQVLELIQVQIGYAASIMVNNSRREMQLQYGVTQTNSVYGAHIVYQGEAPASQAPRNASRPGLLSTPASGIVTSPEVGSICDNDGTLTRDKTGKWIRCSKGKWNRN
ncbi:DotD/TraH family lipoprotein [Escherichia coli]|nr:DotD/TraH family lipoprotein [Escherichia coli]MDY8698605.1 DotD/TraH family lipoprotein [Escherichia coli]MDY8724979.1 DotD/TraH family lipoprotein [Escherichia coli]MDY8846268.1 DotD/TraH family lipoprotein [Escherichia coli]